MLHNTADALVRGWAAREDEVVRPAIDFAPLTYSTPVPPGVDPTADAVSRLAAANGWQYFPYPVEQPLPGAVFRDPSGEPRFSQRAVNIVRIPGSPPVEVGDSYYTEVAVGNQFVRAWGYAAVDLGVTVPSIVVETECNRAVSALSSVPAGSEANSQYAGFRVYAAPGMEGAAEILLTRETMAALDDGVMSFDVELSGQWLFLYAPRSLSTSSPEVWARILSAVDLLSARVTALPVPDVAASVSAQSRRRSVNGGRVWCYLAAVFGAMALAGGAAVIFGGR